MQYIVMVYLWAAVMAQSLYKQLVKREQWTVEYEQSWRPASENTLVSSIMCGSLGTANILDHEHTWLMPDQ